MKVCNYTSLSGKVRTDIVRQSNNNGPPVPTTADKCSQEVSNIHAFNLLYYCSTAANRHLVHKSLENISALFLSHIRFIKLSVKFVSQGDGRRRKKKFWIQSQP